MTNSTEGSAKPGGFWLRTGAMVCDYGVCGVLQFLSLLIIALLDYFGTPNPGALFLSLSLLAVVIQIFYFVRGSSQGRHTFGAQWAGLRVERLDGQPLSPGRALARTVLWMLAASVLFYGGILNFLCVASNREKRAGHDFALKTHVVCVTKPNRPVLTGAIALTVLFCGLWLGRIITPVPLQAFYIPAGSMENTLLINDRLLTNLLVYRFRAPRNDEIAIFQAPKSALLDANSSEKVDFVKRVVGTPGDVVTIVDRQLFRNGARVREPYAKWSDHNLGDGGASSRYSYDMKIVDGAVYSREYLVPNEPGPWIKNNALASEKEQRKITSAKPAPVPPDQFLMLGDHRNNSNDSHIWGFAPRRAFVGRAMFVFWPVQHWKNLH